MSSSEFPPVKSFDEMLDDVEKLIERLPKSPIREKLMAQFVEAETVEELKVIIERADKILALRAFNLKNKRFAGYEIDEKVFRETLGGDEITREQKRQEIQNFRKHLLESAGENLGEGQTADIYTHHSWPDYCAKFITTPEEYKKGRDVKAEALMIDKLRDLNDSGARVPNVMLYHMDQSTHFYVMERIHGYSFAEILSGKIQISIPENFDFDVAFTKLEEFVDAMHARGIHHRDLHEGNIMFDVTTGEFVVIDFGQAVTVYSSEDPYASSEEGPGPGRVWSKDKDRLAEVRPRLRKIMLKKV